MLATLACSEARQFGRGARAYRNGRDARTTRIMGQMTDHPVYGPAAKLVLLTLRSKKVKTLPELHGADTSFYALEEEYKALSPGDARILRKKKLGLGACLSKHARIQRKAVRLAERTNTVPMLDTVMKYFGQWLPKVKPQWDSARTRVVNKNLGTKDYDVATSILNRHVTVVYKQNYRLIWTLHDSIWGYFTDKYPLCQMGRFKQNHPWHQYALDCWYDEAQQMFCQGSLDSALSYYQKYPHTALELIVIGHILNLMEQEGLANLSPEHRQLAHDMHRYVNLILVEGGCKSAYAQASYEEFERLLPQFAPRLGVYWLLMDATSSLARNNESYRARALMANLRPLFRDSSVCNPNFNFQVSVRPRIDSCLACLGEQPVELRYKKAQALNTHRQSEYNAISWDEGEEFYFTRNIGKGRCMIYKSERDALGGWSKPKEELTLSMNKQATALSLTNDGRQMLLKLGKWLYVSQRPHELANWGLPIRLPLQIRGLKTAVFAPEGDAIIVEAIREKSTLGKKAAPDLYFCRLEDGKFEVPKSLGSVINTPGRETNPYLSSDGRTLYFCSDRTGGYGQLDVYMARRTGIAWNSWTSPRNVGCQVNSSDNENGYTWVRENGLGNFFTEVNHCNKKRDICEVDLPAHVRPVSTTQLRGVVMNSKNKPIGRGLLEVVINHGQEKIQVPISPRGRYRFKVPENTFHVQLYVDVLGYYTPRDTSYDLRKVPLGTTLRDTFRLRNAAEVDKFFEVRYASFQQQNAVFDDPRINRELALLARFARRMKATVRIVGHVEKGMSQALSLQRAQTATQLLTGQFALQADSVTAEGKGSTSPTASGEYRARLEVKFGFRQPVLKEAQRQEQVGVVSTSKPLPQYGSSIKNTPKPKLPPSFDTEPEEEEPKRKTRKNFIQKVWGFITGKNKKERSEASHKTPSEGKEEDIESDEEIE